jgi:hypothetical protein
VSTVVVAPGLPETLTFVSVAPLAPPPSPPAVSHAFDPTIAIPANLTNKFITITGSGSILLPAGNAGVGAIGISLQAQVLTAMLRSLWDRFLRTAAPLLVRSHIRSREETHRRIVRARRMQWSLRTN